MKVLYLGPSSPLVEFIRETDEVRQIEGKLLDCDADYIVSYGYRFIIPRNICERMDGKAINLHIALLPWNRGAHPNFWSAAEGTPSGVTIHYINPGIDTGDIIAQKEIYFAGSETLAESYDILRKEIEMLFVSWWSFIRSGNAPRISQSGAGTYHNAKDLPFVDWGKSRNDAEMLCGNVFA